MSIYTLQGLQGNISLTTRIRTVQLFPFPHLRKHPNKCGCKAIQHGYKAPGYQRSLSAGGAKGVSYTRPATWLSQSEGRQEKQCKLT